MDSRLQREEMDRIVLVRQATIDDLPAWQALEDEVAPLFIIPCKTDENRAKEMIENFVECSPART